MSFPVVVAERGTDLELTQLAREIAIDHFPLEDILKHYQISPERWESIQKNPRFSRLLELEIQTWQSAANTKERLALKAAAVMEDYLPEAVRRLHDRQENLSSKVELAKLIAKLGGVGDRPSGADGNIGEKFTVTINLGADTQIKIDKELPPRVIDAEPI